MVSNLRITSDLGQEIIKRVARYTDVDINIMDLNGEIVASTDENRIGELHWGAVEVLKTENNLIIDERVLVNYPGTKEGVNLPIKHNNKIEGVVGVSGKPRDVRKLTGLIRSTVEIIMEQLHIERLGYYKERQWNYWLQQLLHPSGFDKERLEEEAEYLLKVNIHLDFRVIVLTGENGHDVVETIRREIKGMKLDALFVLPFSDNEIHICLPNVFKRVEDLCHTFLKWISKNCKIGIGESGFGLLGIRNSYMQAKQALFFAGEVVKVTSSSDWELERLIMTMEKEESKNICLKYEQSLTRLDRNYIDTIDIFLKLNLSVKKTAEFLHVHRNTLLYRFDQIYKKVGLDPSLFHDACILRIIRTRQICANAQNEYPR